MLEKFSGRKVLWLHNLTTKCVATIAFASAMFHTSFIIIIDFTVHTKNYRIALIGQCALKAEDNKCQQAEGYRKTN